MIFIKTLLNIVLVINLSVLYLIKSANCHKDKKNNPVLFVKYVSIYPLYMCFNLLERTKCFILTKIRLLWLIKCDNIITWRG